MNRFFLQDLDSSLVLRGDNHGHIAYSLRHRVGDEIILFCGDGFDYKYRITDIKKNETSVVLVEKTKNDRESNADVHAYISLIKHDKMSLIYQKLTELGIKEFTPTITEFSQSKKNDFKTERYEKICEEACKQCGRSVLPLVNAPKKLFELETRFSDYDAVIFAYEKADKSIKEQLLKLKENVKKDFKLALIIGPEGGFSEAEVDFFNKLGITPVSLGNRILRAETAAIAAASAVLYELDW